MRSNGLPMALPILAESRRVGRCECPELRFRLWQEHLLPSTLSLGHLCTNLSLSLLLVPVAFFPHWLPLPIHSVLAFNPGFPDPAPSFSLSFPSSSSFFYSPSHTQPALHTHDPSSLSSFSSDLPLAFPHYILASSSLHRVRQDVICKSPLGSFSFALRENGTWDLCPIKQLYKLSHLHPDRKEKGSGAALCYLYKK